MESDIRYYRRRASEELAAAARAVTLSARERRMTLAGVFLERLKSLDSAGIAADGFSATEVPAFSWADARSNERV